MISNTNIVLRLGRFVALVYLTWASIFTQINAAEISRKAVLDVMERVADWQLAHPSNYKSSDWTQGVGDAGFMALAGISGDSKYRDMMYAMGNANQWKLGERIYHADDQCIGQTYAELYQLYRDPKMIAPMQAQFDYIIKHPPASSNLLFRGEGVGGLWSWCDALFMAPPAWMRLYAATGDEKYMDFAVTNWWRTADCLYDTNENLFFRDSTFFEKRETNGLKIFWGRGNGWVLGGLVRTLQYLPMNNPYRLRFEEMFKAMSAKILACQQLDGLWHSSLLDPEECPLDESSGSGLYVYALAWGVNQGLLERSEYEPAVERAWAALVGCVNTDGRLTHVQPIGSDPKRFPANSTAVFGVGSFLLAGSEVYRMLVLENSKSTLVHVYNPADFCRKHETVELNLSGKLSVMDGLSSRILDSQSFKSSDGYEKFLFQVDLAPRETRTYYILNSSAFAAEPPAIIKTFARYVPERHDDIAWESDRIAHRIFGPALETWKDEPLISSGFDVWIKSTRDMVVNHMYRTMDLFDTNSPSQDDYKVGKTRGDGGLGIWCDGKLLVSKNWRSYKIITNGPIRSEFEVTYDAWDAGNGRMVSETKRISIDAGFNLSRVESVFGSDDKSPLQIGVGLAERPGENMIVSDGSPEIDSWQTGPHEGLVVQNPSEGFMTYWQPQDFDKGTTAVAVVLPKSSVETFTNDLSGLPAKAFATPTHTVPEGQPAVRDLLVIANVKIGKPFVYYIGAGWDKSGDFPDAKSWNDYIRRFAECRDEPLDLEMGN